MKPRRTYRVVVPHRKRLRIIRKVKKMDMVEKLARVLCVSEGVDPEHICYGIGRGNKPEGWSGPAWEVRVKHVRAMIAAVFKDDGE